MLQNVRNRYLNCIETKPIKKKFEKFVKKEK